MLFSGFVTGPNGRADSDVDATGEDYMRGEQKTDADGIAEFKTIIPGWYGMWSLRFATLSSVE